MGLTRYQGWRDEDRFKELVETANIYSSPAHPRVSSRPYERIRILPHIDRTRKHPGGMGAFYPIKGFGGRLGIKVFKYSENVSEEEKRARCSRVQKALATISKLPNNSMTSLLLFNQLNVPKCVVTDKSDLLWGVLVPFAPKSCGTEIHLQGEPHLIRTRLGDVICDSSNIARNGGTRENPLTEVAKWSILDSLCQTIACLHHIGLIHADISSSNVFIRWPESTDPKVYVFDAFSGLSSEDDNNEVILSDVFCPFSVRSAKYTAATDVYCLAWWVVHLTMAQDPLFPHSVPRPDHDSVKNGGKHLYTRHQYAVTGCTDNRQLVPKSLHNLLSAALLEAPQNRPSAKELAYAVHDHWMCFGDLR